MTFIELEDAPPDLENEFAQQGRQTIKCSWCGEIIRPDGNQLVLAMCQDCYKQMLDEFLRARQSIQKPTHPSDR